jgi:hypothetical protein
LVTTKCGRALPTSSDEVGCEAPEMNKVVVRSCQNCDGVHLERRRSPGCSWHHPAMANGGAAKRVSALVVGGVLRAAACASGPAVASIAFGPCGGLVSTDERAIPEARRAQLAYACGTLAAPVD